MEAWEEFKQQALLHHWRQQNLAAQRALQQRQQKHMQTPRNADVDDPEEDPESEAGAGEGDDEPPAKKAKTD